MVYGRSDRINIHTSRQWCWLLLVSTLLLLSVPKRSLAEQLKVVDEAGMVRSVQEVSEPHVVAVKVKDTSATSLKLERVDGVAQQRTQQLKDQLARFEKVPPGTWKVLFQPRKVKSVRIEK